MKNPYDEAPLLAKGPEHTALEAEMADSVRTKIHDLRSARYNPADNHHRLHRREEAQLMLESLQNDGSNFDGYPYIAFGSWINIRGEKLGYQRCYEIAMAVCQEERFTLEEAQRILEETPEVDRGFFEKEHARLARLKQGMAEGEMTLEEIPATVEDLSAEMSTWPSFAVGAMINTAIGDLIRLDQLASESPINKANLELIRQRMYDNTDPGRGRMEPGDGVFALFAAMADAMDGQKGNARARAEDLLVDLIHRAPK